MTDADGMKKLEEYGIDGDAIFNGLDDLNIMVESQDMTLADCIRCYISDNWKQIQKRDCEYFDLDLYDIHADPNYISIEGHVTDNNGTFITHQRDADDWDEWSFELDEDLEDAYVPKKNIIGKRLEDVIELVIDAIQDEYDRLYDNAAEKELESYREYERSR